MCEKTEIIYNLFHIPAALQPSHNLMFSHTYMLIFYLFVEFEQRVLFKLEDEKNKKLLFSHLTYGNYIHLASLFFRIMLLF